ncbi:UNVERIFIED_CONTAM: hypothetical protein FKN15_073225 [Acipenser sinensis]
MKASHCFHDFCKNPYCALACVSTNASILIPDWHGAAQSPRETADYEKARRKEAKAEVESDLQSDVDDLQRNQQSRK